MLVAGHSISVHAKSTFVYCTIDRLTTHRPCPYSHFGPSTFRVHSTRGLGSLPRPLTKPESESLSFGSRYPPPSPPLTRVLLPALTSILFNGDGEYLEHVLSRIDTPRLDQPEIDQVAFGPLAFDVPLLLYQPHRVIQATLSSRHCLFQISLQPHLFSLGTAGHVALQLGISGDWQPPSVVQIYNSSPPWNAPASMRRRIRNHTGKTRGTRNGSTFYTRLPL